MSTYYYGIRSQKETYEDIGKTYSLPMKYVYGFDWFRGDSTKIVMVGRLNKNQRDLSLVIASRDTSKENARMKKLQENGEKLTITGNNIIDNADMLKRAPLPSYLKWVLPLLRLGSKFSSIDPHYTRFESSLNFSINDSTYNGEGVLEIMDLK